MLGRLHADNGQIPVALFDVEVLELPKEFFDLLTIALPPENLQRKFVSIVREMESLREKQKMATAEIDDLFYSLIHRMFGGELNALEGVKPSDPTKAHDQIPLDHYGSLQNQ